MGCLCSKRPRNGLQRSIVDSDEYHSVDMMSINILGTYPSIPISYSALKKELRAGLMADARVYWWPVLPRVRVPPRQHVSPESHSYVDGNGRSCGGKQSISIPK